MTEDSTANDTEILFQSSSSGGGLLYSTYLN